jgi:acyl-CoA synthetase (AMP-forming)/AMP-acid ligase II
MPSDADVLRFISTRLRRSKTPERVHIWPEIPRSETGKISRRQIIDLLQAEAEGHR